MMYKKKMYFAKEIGELYGISAKKVGILANRYDLKRPEYGTLKWCSPEKSPLNSVHNWMYYESVLPLFDQIMKNQIK